MSADLSFPQGPVPFDDPDEFHKTRKTLSIPQRLPHQVEAEKARQLQQLRKKHKWVGLPKDEPEPDEADTA